MGIAGRWRRCRPLPAGIAAALEALEPLLVREGVLLAYLFGSLGRGQPGQDVDLAILARDAPAYRLRDKIAAALGTERLDLVDLGRAPPVLRFELATLRLYRDTEPLRSQQREYLRRRMAS